MNLNRWGHVFLMMGAIMTAIGTIPLLIVSTLAPGLETILPGLLFFLVAPIGALILVIGIILWLLALIPR